jgi:Na+/H+ antiporter NhaD/arsenite permease-like protein
MTLVELARHPLVLWTIFAAVYFGMALGRPPGLVIDRAGMALLGAALMLATGAIDVSAAWGTIDVDTILLLFGLMLFSAQLRLAGFYDAAASAVARLTDSPHRLLVMLILVAAGLSAVLVNDIVCLAFTPLLCTALRRARRDPIPYLIALACASNIGSAATIIGNPQNMYIGAAAGLDFARFLFVMLPATVLGLLVCWGTIRLLMRDRIAREVQADPAVQLEPAIDVDRRMIRKTLALLGVVIVCLFAFSGPGRAIGAVAVGLLLLCSRSPRASGLLSTVDWNLILLFIGLFIVNGAMDHRGLTQQLFKAVADNGVNLHATWPLSGVTLVLSNVVSNVPAVILLSPTLQQAGSEKLWYLLALVSTWAGNLTLVGSIANLIVAEQAAKFGVRLSFREHIVIGLPVTIVSVVLGTLYIAMVM